MARLIEIPCTLQALLLSPHIHIHIHITDHYCTGTDSIELQEYSATCQKRPDAVDVDQSELIAIREYSLLTGTS